MSKRKPPSKPPERCPACDGMGFVFDPGCLAKTCAHAGERVRVPSESPKDPPKWKRRRVMPCPPRACTHTECEAGDAHRRMVRKAADRQRIAFAAAEREAAERGGSRAGWRHS